MKDSNSNYAKRSLKDTFLTNPVTLLLGVYFLTQVVCHIADYFINVALNPDMETAFWVSNYGLPVFIKAIISRWKRVRLSSISINTL